VTGADATAQKKTTGDAPRTSTVPIDTLPISNKRPSTIPGATTKYSGNSFHAISSDGVICGASAAEGKS
jgi:hypothetical protein